MLEEFSLVDLFNKVRVNMTSCIELEDEKMEKKKSRRILQKMMTKL